MADKKKHEEKLKDATAQKKHDMLKGLPVAKGKKEKKLIAFIFNEEPDQN